MNAKEVLIVFSEAISKQEPARPEGDFIIIGFESIKIYISHPPNTVKWTVPFNIMSPERNSSSPPGIIRPHPDPVPTACKHSPPQMGEVSSENSEGLI